MLVRRIVVALLGLIFCAATFAGDSSKSGLTYISVLEAARAATSEKVDRGGSIATMNALYALRDRAANPDSEFVRLLDYYIGDSNAGILDEFITKRGASILPDLRRKLGTAVSCVAGFGDICRKDGTARDHRIGKLISAIGSGVVLCVDNSNC